MRTLGSLTIRESVYYGALYGIMTWLVYASVEFLFSYILPCLFKPGWSYFPLHWGYMALLFCIYSVVGMVLGGIFILGFCLLSSKIPLVKQAPASTFMLSIATLTVVLFFSLNFVIQTKLNIVISAFLTISLLLAIGLLISSVSSIWFSRLAFFVNPWIISFLLLGLPWITLDQFSDYTKIVKAILILTYFIIVLSISYIIQRLVYAYGIDRSKIVRRSSFVRTLSFLTLVVFVILGVNAFLNLRDQDHTLNITKSDIPSLSVERPNVVLVTMDTVRADHISLYGYKKDTTPNLRVFSGDATLYTNAMASGAMTLSTHASIFTGLNSRRHGAHYTADSPTGQPLAEKFHTLAEILSENDYLTLGVAANRAYLTHNYRLDQGFLYYDLRAPVLFFGETESYFLREMIRKVLTPFFPPSGWDRWNRSAEEINKEVFKVLDNMQRASEPFFLFVNYMDAHHPTYPSSPFDTLFPGKDNSFTSARYYQMIKEVMKLERKMNKKEYNHIISQYDGGIASIDFHLGKLFERLKELGIYENTLIIITSDHGEVFGRRDFIGHAYAVYQDEVYIPLIIKYPNVNEGHVADEIVSVVDIMPTVLDVVGIEVPKGVHGQSLLKPKQEESRIVISESYPRGSWIELHSRFDRIQRAIYSWPYKLILATTGERELYNLFDDPNEFENLYIKDDSLSKELENNLNHWLEIVEEESAPPVKLDKKTIDNLKALGYIQ